MKSAYELAMERMERDSGPTAKLNDEQRARMAEIDKIYDAKAAETKLSFESKVPTTQEELEEIQRQMASSLQSIEDKREQEKETVWNEG